MTDQSSNFTYDDLHRLTGASGAYARTYSYDAHDNITFKTGPGNFQNATSTRVHLLMGTDQNPNAYTYDANGNTTARPNQTLTWNSENWLASVFNTQTSTTTESYVYDGDGVRVVETSASEGTIHYVNRYYQVSPGATTTVSYWLGDRLVAVKTGTSTQFVHVDHLGSAAARSDSSGAGAWRAYYPSGELR
ncbi:MAG: RHS repeat protein, partial [Chloroflexi bacterium]|nr:RHS repeat protein [Chloroflexota bacterium]